MSACMKLSSLTRHLFTVANNLACSVTNQDAAAPSDPGKKACRRSRRIGAARAEALATRSNERMPRTPRAGGGGCRNKISEIQYYLRTHCTAYRRKLYRSFTCLVLLMILGLLGHPLGLGAARKRRPNLQCPNRGCVLFWMSMPTCCAHMD